MRLDRGNKQVTKNNKKLPNLPEMEWSSIKKNNIYAKFLIRCYKVYRCVNAHLAWYIETLIHFSEVCSYFLFISKLALICFMACRSQTNTLTNFSKLFSRQ